MLSEEQAIEIVSNLKTYYEAYYLLSNEEIEENEEKNEAIEIVLKLIIRLEKENELAKEQLKKQCEIADERNDLLVKVQKLQKENETTTKLNANMSQRHLNDTFKIKNYEKQIELMAEAFKQDDVRTVEEIIEYFKNLAKGE